MTLKQAFIILRHGSYEGHQKYLEAVKVIEDELDRKNETIEQIKTALFKCGEDAVEIDNYKKIAEYQQSLSMDRFFEIQRLKEELALAKKAVLALTEERMRLQKEIDTECDHCGCVLLDQRDNAKADAIKEFAERMKKQVFSDATPHDYELLHMCIDGVAKELTKGG